MVRQKRILAQAGLLLIVCAIVAVSQQPLPGRRGLTQEDSRRVLATYGDTGPTAIKFMQAQGWAGNLTPSQLATFRQRGIKEMDLMMYYDEFGITPQESDAIKRAGFNIESRPFEIWHWAALADVVCIGKVTQKRGDVEGPYHTYVDIESIEYLKNRQGQQEKVLQTRLLHSGPRRGHKEDVVKVDAQSEPSLHVGEKVLLFLTRKPFSLILLLAQAEAYGSGADPNFQNQYGTTVKLRSLLNQPGPYEILNAYKIVGSKAVSKLRALHVPLKTEIIGLDQAKQAISKVATAQKQFQK